MRFKAALIVFLSISVSIAAGQTQSAPGDAAPSVAHSSSADRLLAMVDDYYEHYRAGAKKVMDGFLKSDSLSSIKRALAETSTFQIENKKFRSVVASATAASRFLAERPLLAQLEAPGFSAFLAQQDLIAKSIASMATQFKQLASTVTLAERFTPMILY